MSSPGSPEVIGARIKQCIEGWQATIINRCGEETCPLRVSEKLAFDDVKRYAPKIKRSRIQHVPFAMAAE